MGWCSVADYVVVGVRQCGINHSLNIAVNVSIAELAVVVVVDGGGYCHLNSSVTVSGILMKVPRV